MPVFGTKAVFFFEDGKSGWSESYYDTGANPTLSSTYDRAMKLARARAKLLAGGGNPCGGAGCNNPLLTWVRVSQVGVPRNTMFGNPMGVTVIPGGVPTGWGLPDRPSVSDVGVQPPDNPYSAILMICGLAGGGQSKRPLSGVPDALVCDQSFDRNNAFIKAWKQFATELTNGSWGALSALGAEATRNPALGIQIGSVTQDALGRPILTPVTPIPQPAGINCCTGARVTVSCYVADHGTPVINGTYRAVLGITGTQITSVTLKHVFRPLAPFCPGYFQFYAPVVLPFTSAVLDKPMQRKRGRPFGLSRGRSRTRR